MLAVRISLNRAARASRPSDRAQFHARAMSPRLALAADPGMRSRTVAEALPATIVALEKQSRRRSYLPLLAVVMVAASIGSLLVLWLR